VTADPLRSLLHRLIGTLPSSVLRRLGALQYRSAWLRRLFLATTAWMRTREVTIPHGVAAGLRFDPGGANPGYGLGTNEPDVQRAIAAHLKPGGVFYDLGANVGFHTVNGARVAGPTGHVVAFEPIPDNAAALRRNVERNGFTNVRVIEAAVSSAPGRQAMRLGAEPGWAKLADAASLAAGDVALEVPLVTIDDLVARGEIEPPTVVKMDVEGAEVAALRGMSRTLSTARPVLICELHGTAGEVVPLLREFGYDLRPLESDMPLENLGPTSHVLASPTGARR
jgi:FkbM family methyltransferase